MKIIDEISFISASAEILAQRQAFVKRLFEMGVVNKEELTTMPHPRPPVSAVSVYATYAAQPLPAISIAGIPKMREGE